MKKTNELLDEAFREFDIAAAEEEGFEAEDQGSENEEALDLGEDDADAGEAFSFEDDETSEYSLDEGETEEGVEAPAPAEDEPFSLDEDEGLSEEDADAGEDTPVIASVEEIEADIMALHAAHGLNNVPKGTTASATVDYLLNSGAIWELKPITASETEEIESALDDIADSEESFEAPAEDEGDDEADALDAADAEAARAFDADLADEGETEEEGEPTPAAEPVADEAESAADCGTPATASASIIASVPEVNMHPVADADLLAIATVEDVQMVLSNTEDPVWNVIVAGVPAACIKLSSLPNGAAVRTGFVSKNYEHNMLSIMRNHGVVDALVQAKAEFFASSFKTSELAHEIRASVAEELSTDHVARTVALRENLLEHSRLVIAGMAKGYFAKTANPLFAKAREVLASRGVADADLAALEIVSASNDMFAIATERAVDLMDRDPQFVEQLKENIDEMAPRISAADAQGTYAPVGVAASAGSLSQRLADQSFAAPAPAQVVASTSVATRSNVAHSSLAGLVGRLGPRTR